MDGLVVDVVVVVVGAIGYRVQSAFAYCESLAIETYTKQEDHLRTVTAL